jgi:hypothetical protein
MSAFGVTSDISANQGSSFNFRLLRTLLKVVAGVQFCREICGAARHPALQKSGSWRSQWPPRSSKATGGLDHAGTGARASPFESRGRLR